VAAAAVVGTEAAVGAEATVAAGAAVGATIVATLAAVAAGALVFVAACGAPPQAARATTRIASDVTRVRLRVRGIVRLLSALFRNARRFSCIIFAESANNLLRDVARIGAKIICDYSQS
jgi:hypothetical protein